MLRIPMAFELTPINRLRSAEDLYRLSASQANNDKQNERTFCPQHGPDGNGQAERCPAEFDAIEGLSLPYLEMDASGIITRAIAPPWHCIRSNMALCSAEWPGI